MIAPGSASSKICLSRAGGSVGFSTTTILPALRTARIAAMSGASCRISNATRSPTRAAAGNQRLGEPVGGGVQFCVRRLPFPRADGRARRMPRHDLRETFGNGLFHVAQIFIGHSSVDFAEESFRLPGKSKWVGGGTGNRRSRPTKSNSTRAGSKGLTRPVKRPRPTAKPSGAVVSKWTSSNLARRKSSRITGTCSRPLCIKRCRLQTTQPPVRQSMGRLSIKRGTSYGAGGRENRKAKRGRPAPRRHNCPPGWRRLR